MPPSAADPERMDWPATTDAGRARLQVMAKLPGPPPPDAWVEYDTAGSLLIIGPADRAWPLARQLSLKGLDCAVLATRPPQQPPESAPPSPTVHGTPLEMAGHLGAFTLAIDSARGLRESIPEAFGRERADFDLVLDLQPEASIAAALKPPGYFHGFTEAALGDAMEQLPSLIGTFQKPRYFAYDASICAHGARGLSGCRNCLDACATGAAISIGEQIEVDPYLCQGCGSCATSCPSGAIRYALPEAAETVNLMRRALADFRRQAVDAPAPILLLYSVEHTQARVEQRAETLPEHVLPLAVEDVGAIGPEVWLSALAFGAAQVWLLAPQQPLAQMVTATQQQIDVVRALLAGLGDDHAAARVTWSAEPWPDAELPALVQNPATFAGLGGKREILQRAIAHLWQDTGATAETTALPAAAPLGGIDVDRDACTLCMACVSVCPASAVTGGGDDAKLLFREDRCLQCGLCASACPEHAITLQPRIDFRALATPQTQVLNEEALLACLDCGKPFATRKIIDRMAARLADHWMFQDDAARERLYTCEDCRVRRVLSDENAMAAHRPQR